MDFDDAPQVFSPKPAINLSDSDDNLPSSANLAAKGPPLMRPAEGAAALSPNSKNGAVKRNGVASTLPVAPLAAPVGQKGASYVDAQQPPLPFSTDPKMRVNPAKVYKEGFLFKQQPSWPYSNQKRYCVLKNCRLYYFDSQENMKGGKPQGVIDLTNAKLTDPGNEANLPSNFGIHVRSDRQADGGGSGGNKKERTFIFSVLHVHELGEWRAAVQAVVGDTEEDEGAHWFEKMVQGVY
ncbi:hypothetical protein TraAM80_08194 [Trypanosoma rangeli]|uniref:PH domain-containing protein n=1 Tax=Trypanosoma rangeli TaxID=5698 RepID=A0A3R7JZR5_TRYRA|nr:uncharacterized protein TraAM80_08194 [Trypanosoma rangeli]RNE99442.1 hypothetical protein TraAM80_08194 [Trypanosoma rangeli]|eukprot:RNE99442.1 hypothetical protein TraAM80_08194 [Trypanosoma rangeli]